MDPIRLPLCSRSWIVALFEDADMARLQEFLPTLLHHVEAEGLDHVHHRSTRSLTPAVRAAFAAARIRSAEAADVCGTASQAYLVLAPSGALR